jgi:hypothetical protein
VRVGIVANVVVSRRSSATGISQPDLGSVAHPMTKYTLPVNGAFKSGPTAVIVPVVDMVPRL